MTSFKVKKGPLKSTIHLPRSKSYANRLLILASVNEKDISLTSLPLAEDVVLLMKALEQIGLVITRSGDTTRIENSFPACEREGQTIEVGEGGTTARFLACLLCLGHSPYTLILGKRLKERPWEEFLSLVKAHGGKATLRDNQLQIQGPLKPSSSMKIDCQRTTQFASGFQLAFSAMGLIVEPLNLVSSESYWNLTQALVKAVAHDDKFTIPLDWSGASYPLAFGALNQKIFFPELQFDPYQGDAQFLEILKHRGSVEINSMGIEVIPSQTVGDVELDVRNCLDLVPALCFYLSHISGIHKLHGIQNLIYKESDRLSEIRRLMLLFERESEVENHCLIIHGHQHLIDKPQDLKLPNDHRMVMMGALFLRHHGGGSVNPLEAVDKSFPGFFHLFDDSCQHNS